MKTYAVVGLGRFGFAVARSLMAPDPETGKVTAEVLAIDIKESHIQDISEQVTHAVQADLRDPEVVQELNLASCDAVILSVGSDISTSVLIALNLKEAGCSCVIAKASNEAHRRILEKLGVDRVIIPESDVGTQLARSLTRFNAYDMVDLNEDYTISRIAIPKKWCGKTLAQLNVRALYDINVLAVQAVGSHEVNISPSAQEALPAGGGTMTVLASAASLRKLCR